MAEPIPFKRLRDPWILLAAGFGAGCSPLAPGTAGTLVAIPLVWCMQQLGLAFYLGITLAICVVGVQVCGMAAQRLGVHDHPGIVFDEIAGYCVTMIAAPAGWQWLLAGFLLFRVFDIIKPWPISWLDRSLIGGWGIMLDDILAGVMALAILQFAAYHQLL